KVDGQGVQTTIDWKLQQAAYRVIKQAVIDHSAKSGSAVIMDPTTGDILAMANYPSFEPALEANTVIDKQRRFGANAAVESRLEPGSVMKVLT
ncbi:penicillin-binding transpeptidase domain-containing protein, partial [Acinetobacter baumannii]